MSANSILPSFIHQKASPAVPIPAGIWDARLFILLPFQNLFQEEKKDAKIKNSLFIPLFRSPTLSLTGSGPPAKTGIGKQLHYWPNFSIFAA
jgi:hypothetical protein